MQLMIDFWHSLWTGQVLNLGWGSYLLLALLIVVEGPVATLLGAAAASVGFMRLHLVFAAAVAGNVVADVLWYLLGYAGKVEWLLRYGRRFGLRRTDLDRVQRDMQNHSPKVLLIAKLTNVLVVPTLVATGLARVSWRRWFPVTVIGTLITSGALTVIGYYTTEVAKQMRHGLQYLAFASPIIFVLVTLWLISHVVRQHKKREASGN
jgi:membrane-associated protein